MTSPSAHCLRFIRENTLVKAGVTPHVNITPSCEQGGTAKIHRKNVYLKKYKDQVDRNTKYLYTWGKVYHHTCCIIKGTKLYIFKNAYIKYKRKKHKNTWGCVCHPTWVSHCHMCQRHLQRPSHSMMRTSLPPLSPSSSVFPLSGLLTHAHAPPPILLSPPKQIILKFELFSQSGIKQLCDGNKLLKWETGEASMGRTWKGRGVGA